MGLFGGGAAAAPQVVKAPTMPTADASAVELARRRAAAGAMAQSGRMSTVLSQGGTDTKLGA